MKEHQGKDLFKVIVAETSSKILGRKEVYIAENNVLHSYHPFQKLGMSNYIVLNTLSDKLYINGS